MIADLTQSIDSRQKDLQNGTSFAAIRLAQRLDNSHKKYPFKRTPRYRRRVGGLNIANLAAHLLRMLSASINFGQAKHAALLSQWDLHI